MALLVLCLAFTVTNTKHPQPLAALQLVELLFLHMFTAFHIKRINVFITLFVEQSF